MSTSVPLVRPPVPGGRNNSGNRAPRLGLSIPNSPNVRPVSQPGDPAPPVGSDLRPAPPQLHLKTPMGTTRSPTHCGAPSLSTSAPRRPALTLAPLQTGSVTSISSEATSEHSRSGSQTDGGNLPTSAASSISAIGFPVSAVGSTASTGGGSPSVEQDNSMSMEALTKHLDSLRVSLGREPDAMDLDDDGWRAVSKEGKIVELGSLGEGAGGAVTRCILKDGKTVFALKVITTNPDPDVKKQIIRELNFNKSCASDHICRYFGAFLEDSTGTISIAMEFCEGGSLDSVYKEVSKLEGRIGEKVLGKVAEGVLNGLTYLYQHRIIHRDIKPSNILLCRNGQVKLCDFGVSGEFGTKGDANTFIGTSYYMAPERITGQSYTITCDVWSLGVTLLEVAQARFPFPADGTEMQPRAGLIDLLTYIVSQPIPTLKDEKEIQWSEDFKYFIEMCLQKDPRRRATPWRMLEHPWMASMKQKRVNMEHFLRKVWDWKD